MSDSLSPKLLMVRAAEYFQSQGFARVGVPAGLNGPHLEQETCMRNTCHWAILFCKLGEMLNNDEYHSIAKDLLKKILSDPYLSSGHVPVARSATGKDSVNGVIGAAWIIEALITVGEAYNNEVAIDAAVKLCHLFPFDVDQRLWRVRESDSTVHGIDTTLNHQLWLAMAMKMAEPHDARLTQNLNAFCADIERHVRLNGEGMLTHMVNLRGFSKAKIISAAERPMHFLKKNKILDDLLLKVPLYRKLRKITEYHTEKESGYIIFTLHALARMKLLGVNVGRVEEKITTCLSVMQSPSFQDRFNTNRWSYPYNPPGFEFGVVASAFGNLNARADLMRNVFYQKQLKLTFGNIDHYEVIGTPDPETLRARIYCLSLLNERELNSFYLESISDLDLECIR